MGREASCHCSWGAESGTCKVLLEPPEIVVRAPLRRKAALSSLTAIRVEAGELRFEADGEPVALALGEAQAQRWAKALTTPPPTLPAKLGITPATRLLVFGEVQDKALGEAISHGAPGNSRQADLMLAMVRDADALRQAFSQWRLSSQQPPIWIVYAKGSNQPIAETEIRTMMRDNGLIDTKVASVSSGLTALRFMQRK